tara:strand:+ start:2191 stop:3156 length:966 start_codon:yes stop_codon:yes gene_type:complete
MSEISELAINDDEKRSLVRSNIEEFNQDILNKLNENTRRAYLSDFDQYLNFCRINSLTSMSDNWKDTKNSIKAYFTVLVNSNLKRASIQRKLATIKYFLGISELPDPFKRSKLLRDFVSLHLKKSKPAAQKQAEPLTAELIIELNKTFDDKSLVDVRNKLLLNMAFDSLFRASNLCGVEFCHIHRKTNSVFAPYSKTDQDGHGIYGYVSPRTLTLLDKWSEATGIENGPVFRTFSPNLTVQHGPMGYDAMYKTFKSFGARLGNGLEYSCHSTRVGATVSMTEKNRPLVQIIHAGNWKSEKMAVRYGERANIAKGGMAGIIE